jgi:glutathione synthase
MKLLFVADPLESFKIVKDSTFAMMREAQKRGHTLAVCEPKDLMWQQGAPVTAFVRDIQLTGDPEHWFKAEQAGAPRTASGAQRLWRGAHAQRPAF